HLSFGALPATPPYTDPGATPPTAIQLHLTGRVSPQWSVFGQRFGGFPGTWRLVRTDSLVVEWSNGMGGVSVRLHPERDSLSGTATYWFSEGNVGPLAETTVMATSVKCG